MMRLLDRYVLRQLSSATIYALLALLALYAFFDVVREIGDVGQGQYGSLQMLQYVAMQLPARAYELMPLAVLVGGLVAMGLLASHSEWTVMKTSGIGLKRMVAMLLQFGALFALVTLLLGEWVVPALGQRAEQFKLNATQEQISAGNRSGLWIKQQGDIINVTEILPDASLRGITIYRHHADFQLNAAIAARSARLDGEQHWLLEDVALTRLGSEGAVTERYERLRWPVAVNRQLLDVLLVTPEQLSLSALHTYVRHLQANHQQTVRYELAWWRKLNYPLAALVMALVALAFTPQHSRRGNLGLRLFAGICLGLGFHFASRLTGFGSQIYGIAPVLAATLPTAVFALAAIWLIWRQERR